MNIGTALHEGWRREQGGAWGGAVGTGDKEGGREGPKTVTSIHGESSWLCFLFSLAVEERSPCFPSS